MSHKLKAAQLQRNAGSRPYLKLTVLQQLGFGFDLTARHAANILEDALARRDAIAATGAHVLVQPHMLTMGAQQ